MLSAACGGGEGDLPPVADAGPMDSGTPTTDAGPSDLGADAFVQPDFGPGDMGMPTSDAGTCTCPAPTDCLTHTCNDTFTCIPAPAPAGTTCALDETTDGVCIEGTCTMRGCGDTFVEPGPDPAAEGCDDGNTAGDDLCAADCGGPTPLEVSTIGLEDNREHNAYDQAPMIGVDGDGEVLAIWSIENFDGSMPTLSGRRFDRHGAPLGDAFPIETVRHIRPSVIGLAGGGFVVGYQPFDGRVRFRIVSVGGTVGPARTASTDADGSERNLALAPLAAGGFVATWDDGRNRTGVDPHGGVYYRRFGASGTPLDTTERRVAADEANRERDPRVSSDGDTFAIVWIDERSDFSERIVQLRRFDAATGNATDGADLDVSGPGEFVFEPQVTGLTPPDPAPGAEADGDFLVSYRIQGGTAPGIYVRRFDVGEAPTSATFVVDGEEASVAPLQSIVAGDGSVTRHYLLTYLTGETFGGADVIASRPVPMSIDTLRAELDLTEVGFGVVAAPGGLWFHYFRTFDLNNDQLRLFYLPVP